VQGEVNGERTGFKIPRVELLALEPARLHFPVFQAGYVIPVGTVVPASSLPSKYRCPVGWNDECCTASVLMGCSL
jgi:hypothetical protein